MNDIEYHADGFIKGKNPSNFGGGFTIFRKENGNKEFFISLEIKKKGFTNNEAELLGVLYACDKGESGAKIITDSKCIVSWIRNGKAKARPDLNWACQSAKRLIKEKKLIIEWKPRGYNIAGLFNECGRHKKEKKCELNDWADEIKKQNNHIKQIAFV